MPQSPAPPVFFTIKQIAERHPALTERTLRHWIFGAKDRPFRHQRRLYILPGNGFAAVFIRKGNRIFIDEAALFAWLREGNRHCTVARAVPSSVKKRPAKRPAKRAPFARARQRRHGR